MARICMIAYSEYSSDARIRREAEALAARGDDVDFICLPPENRSVIRFLNGVSLHPLNIRRYRGSSGWRYMLSYLRFFWRSFLLVSIRHLRLRYDVVQVHTMPDFMVFSALVPRLTGAGLILDVHDLMPELYMSKFNLGQDHRLIRAIKWMETASVAFAHRAIAVHRPHLEALVSHGNPLEKFEVLLNTPDPAVFAPTRKHCRTGAYFKLVYHGTISKRHGLELALRATALARREIQNLKFSIIGDGDDLERLMSLAEDLQLDAVVDFSRKSVPVHELPALLEDADLGIVPLREDAFTRYMLPVKLMEYAVMGIPAITTRTKTIAGYFDADMVEYISGESAEELAQSIVALHNDPERCARIAARASEFTRQNNWENQKHRYYRLVDSLKSRERRSAAPPSNVGAPAGAA
jgi:glycosyltransferase involved in cell wall biosynthesis